MGCPFLENIERSAYAFVYDQWLPHRIGFDSFANSLRTVQGQKEHPSKLIELKHRLQTSELVLKGRYGHAAWHARTAYSRQHIEHILHKKTCENPQLEYSFRSGYLDLQYPDSNGLALV